MSHKQFKLHISRLMALLLCLMLILPYVPAARAEGESGSCGSNLTWSLTDGILTIEGSGAMSSYTEDSPAPWHAYSSQIVRLSLPDGLTRIGSWAFADCSNLLSVSIPGSVEVIDDSAFRRCSSMTMLTLNSGLRTIGQCAFEQCSALADLRLPGSLINLKNHAFYMCDSLSYVTIPGAVRTIGSGVFCYCSNLVRVDVDASVTLPSWSFYGCNKLEIVTVQGESVDPESLKVSTPPQGIPGYTPPEDQDPAYEEPAATEPAATESEIPAPTPNEGSATGEVTTTDSSGQEMVDKTTVTKNDNSTTVSSTKTPANQQGSSGATTITSTVQNDQGWNDVIDKVNSATIGGNKETINVTVYLPNSDTIPADVLQQFAGKNADLTVQTQSGGKVTLDCKTMEKDHESELQLRYTLTITDDVPEELAGCTVYKLNFHASSQVASEVIIRLPGGHAFGTATLYQLSESDLEQLQSVMVDSSGNAHWYLASMDENTDYLIGIDVPGAVEDSPVIPAELHDVYKVENVYDGVEYVVTGRSSSWGMELGQVMGILAVVMVSVIVVVGVVMFIWNKKRLKAGYVPDWDDDDYE